jgi:signal transduction histidine kinase
MRRLFVRVLAGVQLAVVLYFGLALVLISRDVVPRRLELLDQCMSGHVAYIETRLAQTAGPTHATGRLELMAELRAGVPWPVELLAWPVAGQAGQGAGQAEQTGQAKQAAARSLGPRPGYELAAALRAHGRAVDEVWGGTLYYHALAGGEVLRLGPVPRIVSFRPALIASLLAGMVLVVTLVGVLLAAPVVRDLRVLERAVEGFGSGAFGGRARVRGSGAVAQLARGFDRMADQIERMVVGQRRLFAVVSHELRTPPARIRFALDLLAEARDPEERRAHVRSIDEDLTEIDQLVDELLTYLRLDTDAPPLEREPLEALDVVRALAGRMDGIEERPIAIEVRGEPMQVHAHGKYFRRAIENLVTNALRHARTRVCIEVAATPHGVHVSVSDDGGGVPLAARERIFEPFASLDQSRTKRLGGVGLGLAIVSRILAWHGGAVTVDDAELGGARFTTFWPHPR